MAKKTDVAKATVTRVDQYGNAVEVPVGQDGVNPVSPNNPLVKQTLSDYHVAEIVHTVAEGEPLDGVAVEQVQEDLTQAADTDTDTPSGDSDTKSTKK